MEDLTLLLRLARALGETRETAAAAAAPTANAPTADAPHPYKVGDSVFIRTITYHYTGKIVGVYANEITLVDAAWVADSGRWSEALRTGKLSEVEPFPEGEVIVIYRGAIVDVSPWRHALPCAVK